MMPAAAKSSTPMPIWMRRRGQPATTPAPSHAPATAAAIMSTSVFISTSTTRTKMMASAKVGTECPTLSVPGMFSSLTTFPSLNIDVVDAKEPTPRVSRKSVTKPMPSWRGDGQAEEPAPRARRASRTHTAMNTTPTIARSANRTALAEISLSCRDSK